MDDDNDEVRRKVEARNNDNVLKLMQKIKYDKNEKPITSLQLNLF
jgi:hypothetical protein